MDDLRTRVLNFTVAQKGFLIVALPLGIQLISYFWMSHLLDQSDFLRKKEFHSKIVLGHANWVSTLVTASVACTAGYVLTGDEQYKSWAHLCEAAIPDQFSELKSAVASNAPEGKMVDQMAAEWRGLLPAIAAIEDTAVVPSASKVDSHQQNLMKSCLIKLWEERRDLLLAENHRFFLSPEILPSNQAMLRISANIVLFMSVGGAFALMLLFSKAITKRIDVIAENTIFLAEGKPLNHLMIGNDEISVVDKSFHKMALALTEAQEQLKLSEQRIRSMINNMPVGLIVVDTTGHAHYANAAAEQLFGVGPGALEGQPADSLFPKGFASPGRLSPGKHAEFKVTRANGEEVFVEVGVNTLTLEGATQHLISVVDISERLELIRRKQEFIAVVSHDLRTPLTSIDAFHYMLESELFGKISDRGNHALQLARRSSLRLINLVNDLLDFERLEGGKMKLQCTEIVSKNVTEAAVEAVAGFARTQKIEVSHDDAGFSLNADEDRLVQVLVNLLTNAIKFSPAQATVRVCVTTDEASVEWQVIDQGRGVPDDKKQAIFEKFQQVKSSDSNYHKGLGLGLPICKAIVLQHEGTIGVRDNPDGGSIFWFRIPQRSQS